MPGLILKITYYYQAKIDSTLQKKLPATGKERQAACAIINRFFKYKARLE
jgi:hypothetical protein